MRTQTARDQRSYTPMPPLAAAHLVTGIAWLVVGVSIGIYMSVGRDFQLRPVHAHANLLGWVTNAIFGCFYWLRGGTARLSNWLGYFAFNLGNATLLTGLTLILLEGDAPAPIMPIGTVLVAGSILQMVFAIAGNARDRARDTEVAYG